MPECQLLPARVSADEREAWCGRIDPGIGPKYDCVHMGEVAETAGQGVVATVTCDAVWRRLNADRGWYNALKINGKRLSEQVARSSIERTPAERRSHAGQDVQRGI
jgi:hypothetical protein